MSSLHSIPHGVCSVPEPLGRVSASGGHLGISRPERLWLLSLGEREADWASVLPGMGGVGDGEGLYRGAVSKGAGFFLGQRMT